MKNWMGTGSAALSFVLWGMLPLYYQFMPERPGQLDWKYLEEGPETWRVVLTKLETE